MKNKKVFIVLIILIIISLLIIFYIKNYVEKTVNMKVVWGRETSYKYYDRNLELKDFENIDYSTTFDDLIKQLGEPNGASASGNYPHIYYELNNGKYVVFRFSNSSEIQSIRLCTDKVRNSFILPPRLLEMTKEEKAVEYEHAKKYEINAVLSTIDLQKWNRPSYDGENGDEPLGEYTEELLRKYTEKNYETDISYYFGTFDDSGLHLLFQIIENYEGDNQFRFAFYGWNEKHIWHEGSYSLKGQEEILNIRSEDTDLSTIELSRAKLSKSITAFLLDRKEIRKGLDAWVEFWGVDENGRYVCLFITSPLKREWGINSESKVCSYYYVTIDTKDNKADALYVKQLKRVA